MGGKWVGGGVSGRQVGGWGISGRQVGGWGG